MDKQTKAYFANTVENAQVTRRNLDSVAYRRDLESVWNTARGRQFRAEYADRKGSCRPMSDKERRALSVSILWAQWKERQTGKPMTYAKLPPHARPVIGNITTESAAP